MNELLEARGLRKHFGATVALHGVDLDLRGGEIHGLIGENGAGKSTIVKILSGAIRPDAGSIEVDGRQIELQDPADAQRLGIAVIHQEVRGVPALDLTRNIVLGREPAARLGGWVDWRESKKQAKDVLARVGLNASPDTPLEMLGLAERQLVAIAGALAGQARLLIMDEPTSALSAPDSERLFGLMRSLASDGVTLLFISHRLQEVIAMADRVTVLRDGRHIATVSPHEITPEDLVAMVVGRELEQQMRVHRVEHMREEVPVFRAKHLTGPAVRDVSFDLWKGEIVGLAGQLGSGAVQVGELVAGVMRASAGEIQIDGEPRTVRDPRDAVLSGIALVPEDRRQQGLVSQMSVAENFALPRFGAFVRRGLLRRALIREAVQVFVDRLRIRLRSPSQRVSSLSGGNQQKVVMARWLGMQPKVLVLNEPTRGIDVGAKADVYESLRSLARDGVAVLIASTDVPELVSLCDRVLVMRGGAIVSTLAHDAITERDLVSEVTGASAVGKGGVQA